MCALDRASSKLPFEFWVLGPFVYGRLQNLQTSEVTFAHVITPLTFFVGLTMTCMTAPVNFKIFQHLSLQHSISLQPKTW